MKTKISKKRLVPKSHPLKLKPKPRGKAAKIAYLKRSAAGKAVHHRRRIERHAKVHILITAVLVLFVVSAGVVFAAQVNDLIPPPGLHSGGAGSE